jgi:XXXCH domain-containing protein
MGQEIKFEQTLSPQELRESLNRLADGLTGPKSDPESGRDFGGLPLDALAKIKITVKRTDQGFEFKVKAKASAEALAGVELPADAQGKPKYKSLKKRMKATFKTMTNTLLAGEIPDQALADSFVEDSRLMATYPGKGDEFYPVYTEAVDRFAQARATGDLEALRKSILELDRLKSDCHERYD